MSYLLHLSIIITQPWGRVKVYDGLLICFSINEGKQGYC